MKHIVVATKNAGKAEEFKDFFKPFGLVVSSLLDFNQPISDIAETGSTFAENAAIKAEKMALDLNESVIADDSGLVIDVIGGEPGVYSARYAGEPKNDKCNLQKVLTKLENIPYENRRARFICVLAVAAPNETTTYGTGFCEGHIATQAKGDNGFGYDPVFIPDGYTRTLAELSSMEKNSISHRKHAFEQLSGWLGAF